MTGADEATAEIEATLAALRADLRRGDYARLAVHASRLDAATAMLTAGPALLRLRESAAAAAACLVAAAQGVRAARRRLEEIGSAQRGAAYDARGQRRAMDLVGRRLDLRSNAAEFPSGDQERLNPRRL